MRFYDDIPSPMDPVDDDEDDSFLDDSGEGAVEPDLLDAPVDESPEDSVDPDEEDPYDDGPDSGAGATEGLRSRVRMRPTPTGSLDLRPGVDSLLRQIRSSFSSVQERPMSPGLRARGAVLAIVLSKDGTVKVLREGKRS